MTDGKASMKITAPHGNYFRSTLTILPDDRLYLRNSHAEHAVEVRLQRREGAICFCHPHLIGSDTSVYEYDFLMDGKTVHVRAGDVILMATPKLNEPRRGTSIQKALYSSLATSLSNISPNDHAWMLLEVRLAVAFELYGALKVIDPKLKLNDDDEIVSKLSIFPSRYSSQVITVGTRLLTGLDKKSDQLDETITIEIMDKTLTANGHALIYVLDSKWRRAINNTMQLDDGVREVLIILYGGDDRQSAKEECDKLIEFANLATNDNIKDIRPFLKYYPQLRHYGMVQTSIRKQ